MAANSQHRCVFVGNIPYDASEEQLIQICEEVGPVVSFRLVIDRETGKPKGYGFCEYKDEETALSARRNLQGYEINGRQLRVDFAENDKGTDRNREQGRGGPGFTSSVDTQRPLGGPAVLGDSSLYQSIGIPLAATAASVMAGALGGVQTDSVSAKPNGLQGQSGLGGDPLTHYLANMSRKHLFDIMSEMKVLTTQNRELAHQLLSSSPQLTKAIFQAQIMLGMVSPQVLQMPNIRQPSDSLSQPLLQDAMQDHKPGALPPHPGQTSLQNKMQIGMMPRGQEGQFSSAPQNASINNQPSGLPFQQMPPHPRFPHPLQAQNQHLQQTTQPVQPGASTVPSIRPFNGFTLRPQPPVLEPSITFKPNMQVPSFHNPRPDAAGSIGHDSKLLPSNGSQHTLLPRTSLPQPSFQPGSSTSMLLPGVAETVNKHSDRSAQIADDKTWIPRNNAYPIMPVGMSDKPSLVSGALDPTNRPSKLARLEDGRSAIWPLSQNPTTTSRSEAIPVFGAGSLPADQIPSTEAVQHSDKRVSELQLAPEEESALLQQVMSLTPEQLSSLPPEQRQQVIQLQQMFLR